MGAIFSNVPLPIFLIFSFVLPLIFIINFIRVRKKFPFTLFVCIVLSFILSTIVSFIRIANEFEFFIEKLIYFKRVLFYLFPVTMLLLIIGAFQKTIRDPKNRLIAIAGSLCIVIPIVIIFIIIITS